MMTSTDNFYILDEILVPVDFMVSMKDVHKDWHLNHFDGDAVRSYANVRYVSNTSLLISFVNSGGVYVFGVK